MPDLYTLPIKQLELIEERIAEYLHKNPKLLEGIKDTKSFLEVLTPFKKLILRFILLKKIKDPTFNIRISCLDTISLNRLDNSPDLPTDLISNLAKSNFDLELLSKYTYYYYQLWELISDLAGKTDIITFNEPRQEQIQLIKENIASNIKVKKLKTRWQISRRSVLIETKDLNEILLIKRLNLAPRFILEMLSDHTNTKGYQFSGFEFIVLNKEEFYQLISEVLELLFPNEQ